MAKMPPDSIADAASVILLRRGKAVLMGQRGAGAAFMPSKFVFPGGRVDAGDFDASPAAVISDACRTALRLRPRGDVPAASLPNVLTAAALRELHEETGLSLARPHQNALRFAFRAITPMGPARRFDARFFIADMDDFAGDAETFSAASGELAALQWVPIAAARGLDLPFITRVILAEIVAEIAGALQTSPQFGGVPFFDNSGPLPVFLRL